MDSILTSIKKLLGITEDYTHFDPDIIMHINTIFMVLNQMGIGPSECFRIEDSSSEWTDFISDAADLEPIKTYIGLRVRLIFDPPSSSTVIEAINRTISELEWRLDAISYKKGGETFGAALEEDDDEDYEDYEDDDYDYEDEGD